MTSERAAELTDVARATVLAHWLMSDGRPMCLTDRIDATVPLGDGFVAAPFCGACLVTLVSTRLHGEFLWEGRCLPPDMRPSEALDALRGTAWASMFDLTATASTDTWWFETTD